MKLIKKNHNKKKESKILWITIVIHSVICVDEQWFLNTF